MKNKKNVSRETYQNNGQINIVSGKGEINCKMESNIFDSSSPAYINNLKTYLFRFNEDKQILDFCGINYQDEDFLGIELSTLEEIYILANMLETYINIHKLEKKVDINLNQKSIDFWRDDIYRGVKDDDK